ncbi:MAG TPA: CvpA family protein [Candidatus Eisenbacteria bacterium]|nr:CvpA family protein [Candidatus Eisenbacteria bacterium]
MSLDKLPINGFDLVLIVVLGLGITRGRKLGMSGELVSLLRWLAILFGCAFAYEPVGSTFASTTGIFSKLSAYVIAYIVCALIIVGLSALFKRAMEGRLVGSDFFGRSEYYLGMVSGLIRFSCILLAFLAILNARYYTPQEVRANEKYQNEWYGSNFFPTWQTIQSSVFEKSLTGPFIKNNLSFLLIRPTPPENKELHQKDAKWQ